MSENRIVKSFILCGLLTFFAGCGIDRDPSAIGDVAPAPACEWKPKRFVYKKACARGPSCMLPSNAEPLNIANLIDIALWNNPDTYLTWSDARSAAFNLDATESSLYPILTLDETLAVSQQALGSTTSISNTNSIGGGAVLGNGDSISCPEKFDVFVSSFTLKYLLFDFGGRCASIEAARQALYAANWAHNWEVQTVVFNVLYAYYQHLDALASYTASLSDLEDARATLDAAEKSYQSGVKTIADVLQSQANYSGVKLKVERDYSNVQVTMGKLARELGLPANTELSIEILPENLELAKLNVGIEELMCAAKEYRPDLSALQAQLLEKEAQLRVAQSDGKPQVIAGGSIEDDYYLNNTDFNSYVYNAGMRLQVPIFSGFYYRNRIKQARAEVQAACAKLNSKEYDILLEVLEAYYDYQTAVTNFAFSVDFVDSSEQNYEVANANYRHGTGTILDLLTAQKTLAEARAQKIEARTLWLTSLANIAYQTGTIGAIENGHSCGYMRR